MSSRMIPRERSFLLNSKKCSTSKMSMRGDRLRRRKSRRPRDLPRWSAQLPETISQGTKKEKMNMKKWRRKTRMKMKKLRSKKMLMKRRKLNS